MLHELVGKVSMLISESGQKLKVRLGILKILVAAWEINADVNLSIVPHTAQLKQLKHKKYPKKRKELASRDKATHDVQLFPEKVNVVTETVNQEDVSAGDDITVPSFSTEVKARTSLDDNVSQISGIFIPDLQGSHSAEENQEITAVKLTIEASATTTDSKPSNMDHHQEQVSTTSADEHQEHVVTITDSEPSNTDPHQQVACTICNRIYKNEHDLQMHMGMHTETSYKCTQCGKTYRSSGPLKRHTMLVHSGEALIEEDGDDGVQKQFSCNICHKIFEHKSNLTQHMRVHTGYPRHQKCTVCGKSYPYCVHIKNHLLEPCAEAVESNDPNGQKCHVCSEDFSSEQDYAAHMQMHNNSYDCDVCQETFSEAKYLVKHRRIHTGEKPCQCEHCGESFADDSELKSHMLVHTVERLSGTRRHECCVCHKTFKMRDELKRHMLLHTRGGPYECPQCRQACSGLPGLKRHMRVHTGSKPFVCGCGMAFTSNGNMMAHMKRRH